ncbi:hypothetical protein [Actinoplanes sp. NPDC049265]|uniref:hypothetical protein n=1 Tax=Actinoplanes sp. NPDC049265 TaxID=3363902 RepID=UPI00371DFB74
MGGEGLRACRACRLLDAQPAPGQLGRIELQDANVFGGQVSDLGRQIDEVVVGDVAGATVVDGHWMTSSRESAGRDRGDVCTLR